MGWRICAIDIRPGMSKRQEIISYWLVPSLYHTKRFQRVIDALAEQQGAPKFHPHLSFGSFADKEPELGEVLPLLHGLELRPTKVAHSPSFTMSLFVRFEATEQHFECTSGTRGSPRISDEP